MDDLISREAAKAAIRNKFITIPMRCEVNEILNAIPAVDAAPVVHSRWNQTDAYPQRLYCLNCYHMIVPNVDMVERYDIPTNYCPSCGAKMDGEANG